MLAQPLGADAARRSRDAAWGSDRPVDARRPRRARNRAAFAGRHSSMHAARSAAEQAAHRHRGAARGPAAACDCCAATRAMRCPPTRTSTAGSPSARPRDSRWRRARASTQAIATSRSRPSTASLSLDAASTPIDERIALGVDRIRAVRAAIGHDVALMVDCHWRFDAARAEALMRTLRDVAPYWIECPISEHPCAIRRHRTTARDRARLRDASRRRRSHRRDRAGGGDVRRASSTTC